MDELGKLEYELVLKCHCGNEIMNIVMRDKKVLTLCLGCGCTQEVEGIAERITHMGGLSN